MRNTTSDVFGPSADCPSDQDLLTGLHAPADAATESRERHVTACPYCTARLELFRTFESGKPARDEEQVVSAIVSRLRRESPARPQPWWYRLSRPRILAPAALVLAAASVLMVVNIKPRSSNLDLPVDTVLRSASVTAIAPLGDLPRAPEELRWQPVAGAARYQVEIVEVDRTKLWASQTDSTSVNVPLNVRAEIVPLKTLRWEVTAFDAAGNSIASSGLRSFTVRK